jgi:hypothetical protein
MATSFHLMLSTKYNARSAAIKLGVQSTQHEGVALRSSNFARATWCVEDSRAVEFGEGRLNPRPLSSMG